MASTKTLAVLPEVELEDGQMKEVDFGNDGGKVLLSKLGGEVCATSAFCTHYGAPLSKGVLVSSGRITCPWHGACFSARTGDIEDGPALSAIHNFPTSVKNGQIEVTADPTLTTKENKSRPQSTRSKKIQTTTSPGVVIVGGGSGSIATIIGLRESSYPGPITILSAEPYAPIDRTKLSKALITDAKALEWFGESTLERDYDVNLRKSVRVSSVDVEGKSVSLEGGGKVAYETLVLATGATPSRLPIPGADLPNVLTLRGVEDAKKIDDALGAKENSGKRLVVVGSSFIGMELVAAVAKRGLKTIHVVGMTEYPFEAVLGAEVGKGLRKYHESQGVKFHGKAKTTAITAPSSSTSATIVAVEYESGGKVELEADVVVMAVGVKPATGFLKDSGIETRKDGGVLVDDFLRVKGVNDVYAIGDIAVFTEFTTGEQARIEHWNVAQNHGRAVASGISGKPLAFEKTPVFWSAQGQQLRYVGYGVGYEDVIVKGDPAELKFVAYYIKGDKVIAVSGMQADPLPLKCSELLRLGLMPSAEEIRSGKDPLSIDVSSSSAHVRK